MGPDINERIEREAEYFDHKQFQREGYEAALAYLNNGIGRQRRSGDAGGHGQARSRDRLAIVGMVPFPLWLPPEPARVHQYLTG